MEGLGGMRRGIEKGWEGIRGIGKGWEGIREIGKG